LGALSEATWRSGDGERAEGYRRRGLMLAQASEDRESFAQAQLALAEYMSDSGQPQDALARLESTQALFEELGKRHHVAHCLLLRGDIVRGRAEHKEAAQLYRKAHRFYEMFRDRHGLTACKRSLAVLALSIGRLPDTQSLLRDALEGYRAMGSKRGEAICWICVGQLEAALGKHEKAMKTLSDAARSLRELGDVRAELAAQAIWLAAAERAGMHAEVEQLIPKLISRIDSYAITSDAVAGALGELSTSVGERRPELTVKLRLCAEQAWTRLGRSVRVEA
ncbi:MAG: tetratricopeptide repeat protein, partial [Myxococcota bacterium]